MVVFFIFFCKACKNTIYFFNPGSTILQNKNKQHLTNKNNHEMHCFLVKVFSESFF
jgi:predicted amidohydrolase